LGENIRTCPNCGAELREDAKFCDNCGCKQQNLNQQEQVSQASPDEQYPQREDYNSQKQKEQVPVYYRRKKPFYKNPIFIVVIITILILAISIPILLLNDGEEKEVTTEVGAKYSPDTVRYTGEGSTEACLFVVEVTNGEEEMMDIYSVKIRIYHDGYLEGETTLQPSELRSDTIPPNESETIIQKTSYVSAHSSSIGDWICEVILQTNLGYYEDSAHLTVED